MNLNDKTGSDKLDAARQSLQLFQESWARWHDPTLIAKALEQYDEFGAEQFMRVLFYVACQEADWQLADACCQLGFLEMMRASHLKSAFFDAMFMGDRDDVVQWLMERGEDAEVRNLEGRTPLLEAVYQGFVAVVEVLASGGADLEASCGRDGETPLAMAAAFGKTSIAEVLLRTGADPLHANAHGVLPEAIAQSYGHLSIAEMIRGKAPQQMLNVRRVGKQRKKKGRSE